jgi:hypothetical protein
VEEKQMMLSCEQRINGLSKVLCDSVILKQRFFIFIFLLSDRRKHLVLNLKDITTGSLYFEIEYL